MGFLSYGAAKGLGVSHDFQKDIENLYNAEAYKSQVRAEKEQKTRYYSELMKEHTAVAPSMVSELEDHYMNLNSEIADFAMNNPNFETDVNKMQQFHSLTDKYLNNDMVRKDIQSQEQFELLKTAMSNGDIDPESDEYMENMDRYSDWMENGGDGFMFQNPEVVDYSELIIDANKNILPDVKVSDTGKRIMEITETPYSDIISYASTLLSIPKNRRAIQKAYDQVEDTGFYKNILDFLAKEIEPGEVRKENFVSWNLAYKTQLDISKQKQAKIDSTYPYFTQDLAGLGPGQTIKGFAALRTLTEFGEKGKVDLGRKGREVFVDDPNNPGKVMPVTLMGQLISVGTPEMKTMFGEAFVKVNVETIVDENKDYEVEATHEFKENADAEPQTFTTAEWMEFKKGLGLNEKQLGKLEAGVYRDMTFSTTNTSTYGRMYTDAGFTAVTQNVPGMIDLQLNEKKVSFPKYSGSVWMPASLTPETLTSYEKSRGGVTHAGDIHEAKATKFENVMYELANAGNIAAARETINDTMTTNKVVYLTDQGKKATEDNYSKKVDMGSWESTKEDRRIFVQKMTETNKDGRSSSIEYYYDSMTGKYYSKNIDESVHK